MKLQFPSDYPDSILFVETVSKYISENLLKGIVNVCEQELHQLKGKPQVYIIISLVLYTSLVIILLFWGSLDTESFQLFKRVYFKQSFCCVFRRGDLHQEITSQVIIIHTAVYYVFEYIICHFVVVVHV